MRDILVYADNFTRCTPSMEYAMRLAASFDARLTGVYVCPSPIAALAPYDAPQLLAAVVEEIRQLEEEAYAGRDAFTAKASELAVSKARWQVGEGNVADVLAHLGNWHDAIVLGREPGTTLDNAAMLGSAVLGSKMPCLVVPPACALPRLECIALAWNGSAEAIRAIHAAQPILEHAQRIVVLAGKPRERFSELGWKPEFKLASYLDDQGLRFEQRDLETSDEDAGRALLGASSACGADLLVMGAYGRTRFSEWIFGGATRHVLAEAAIPVFMRH
jgi:nucleotide-binding universal stress UspA family protein